MASIVAIMPVCSMIFYVMNGVLTVVSLRIGGGAHDTKEAALNGLDIEMGSYTNGLTSDNSLGYNLYYLADPYLEMLKKGELPMAVSGCESEEYTASDFPDFIESE